MNDKLKGSEVILVHRIQIKGNSLELFGESDKNDSSVTELDEKEIIQWLFNDKVTRNFIIEKITNLPVEEVFFKLEVKEPLLTKKEQKDKIGDVDVILVPIKNPEKSIAIEFKRIKSNTSEENITTINKIEAAKKKSKSQIKYLREFDYFKTYLGVIIEDDSRNVKSPNTVIRHTEKSTVEDIQHKFKEVKLESNAGLLFIKVTQPTGESFNSRFNFAMDITRNAKEIVQNKRTTSRIIELLKSENENLNS